VVTGVDLGQQPVVVVGTGELARCLQHETGHLRGELYIDGLTGPERRAVLRQRRQRPRLSTASARGGGVVLIAKTRQSAQTVKSS
jgi:hypothetical protein